jgi:hypothetical protein
MTRFALVVLAALFAVPAALAGYPSTFAMQGGVGVVSRDGETHFAAMRFGADTRIVASGSKTLERTIAGSFGIPTLRDNLPGLSMFRSGTKFMLQSLAGDPRVVKTTSFRTVRTADLKVLDTIRLKGVWSFDALSPNGRWLYLTQHRSIDNLMEYVVRAYDLRAGRLVPGRIADRTQTGWVMHGWPAARTESRDGRFVYTLYGNPNGFPFVHALDTMKRQAHCIGIAWQGGDQGPLMQFSLRVEGGKLLVENETGGVYRSIDRTTYAVRAP